MVDERDIHPSCRGLWSLVASYRWEPGLNVAGNHSNYGFYGFKSSDLVYHEVLSPNSKVFGTILCWGKVVVAERGARCEKAIIESLIIPDDDDLDEHIKIVNMAQNYDAKVISRKDASDLAGGLVPLEFEDVT